MQRLRDYGSVLAWQSGLGYIALWALTFWTFDYGPGVFAGSGLCHPDSAKVLFYWSCDAASPLSILASLANFALTVTVWAPVYLAAAFATPEAIVLAVPILSVHVIGLPSAILVATRLMLMAFGLVRRINARCVFALRQAVKEFPAIGVRGTARE
jgi:hypothetical protein